MRKELNELKIVANRSSDSKTCKCTGGWKIGYLALQRVNLVKQELKVKKS
jgi:hypothetical protein